MRRSQGSEKLSDLFEVTCNPRDVNNLAVAVQTEEVLIASEKAMCEPSLT